MDPTPLKPVNDEQKSYVQVHGPAIPQKAERLEMAAAAEPTPRKVAVIVAHGMGSQVPFQTLQMIADPLRRRALKVPTPSPAKEVDVELVDLNGTQLPRARMTIKDHENQPVEVHLYEIYWAPLTEGKVTARDTVWFLLVAGLRGLWGALFEQTGFQRWMFGDWRQFGLRHVLLAIEFLLAVAVLLSLVVMNLSIAAVKPGTSPGELSLLTCDLWWFEIGALVLVGVGVLLPTWFSRIRSIPGIRWFSRLCVGLMILLTLWTGMKVGYHLFTGLCTDLNAGASGQSSTGIMAKVVGCLLGRWSDETGPCRRIFLLTWLFAFVISWIAVWFLRQYVGDVAVYVSSYAVSKFDDIRNQIQEAAMKVAGAVYGVRSGSGFEYEEIVVTGHSLGSVIAYDTLNALQNLPRELLHNLSNGMDLNVPGRTKVFLTFGSPLDKTAFIFRNQRPQRNDVREALAAAKQPMILDYEYRPKHWVNIYSPDDWISGALNFYDPPNPSDPKRVVNLPDPEANIPLAAHTFYWGGKIFAEQLYQAIIR